MGTTSTLCQDSRDDVSTCSDKKRVTCSDKKRVCRRIKICPHAASPCAWQGSRGTVLRQSDGRPPYGPAPEGLKELYILNALSEKELSVKTSIDCSRYVMQCICHIPPIFTCHIVVLRPEDGPFCVFFSDHFFVPLSWCYPH